MWGKWALQNLIYTLYLTLSTAYATCLQHINLNEVTTLVFMFQTSIVYFAAKITFFCSTQHDKLQPNLKQSSTETEYEVWKLLSCSFTYQSQKNPIPCEKNVKTSLSKVNSLNGQNFLVQNCKVGIQNRIFFLDWQVKLHDNSFQIPYSVYVRIFLRFGSTSSCCVKCYNLCKSRKSVLVWFSYYCSCFHEKLTEPNRPNRQNPKFWAFVKKVSRPGNRI